jgi:hypothetical protein
MNIKELYFRYTKSKPSLIPLILIIESKNQYNTINTILRQGRGEYERTLFSRKTSLLGGLIISVAHVFISTIKKFKVFLIPERY